MNKVENKKEESKDLIKLSALTVLMFLMLFLLYIGI